MTAPTTQLHPVPGSEATLAGRRLAVENMTKRFGGLVALDGVSLVAEPGQITALIGPNGAGKTTLFNCLTGSLRPDQGTVTLDQHDLTALAPHERSHAGLGRTFQRLEVFSGLTVFENLQVACEAHQPRRSYRSLLTLGSGNEPQVIELVESLLDQLGLTEVSDVPAGDLPTGLLRVVELGRCLATRPRALLLDEPASGQDATETEQLQDLLVMLAGDGLTVLLVEHDVELVMSVSKTIFVMDFGRIIASGTPDEVSNSPEVRAAYLGVEGG
jgi:ABC-type branched-subunit amino acid transport system ATPase component